MEEVKTVLRDAFGESSGSEDLEEARENELEDPSNGAGSGSVFGEIPSWERISGINGLWLCRDFLSTEQQSSLLSAIQKEGWFMEASSSGNQAMRFGDIPGWAIELSDSIRKVVFFDNCIFQCMDSETCDKGKEACPFPFDLLWREPLFDQLIVNTYQPGEGICAHVDLMRFEDGIAIISLESSCVMHFTRLENEVQDDHRDEEIKNLYLTKIPAHLTPGSLVLMWGEARYHWKHEINRNSGFQNWEGQEIVQGKRTSITLRKLC